MKTYTVAEDRAFLEEKIRDFVRREAGYAHLIAKHPELYEADDPLKYLQNLRTYECDNPESFPDSILEEIIAVAWAKQKQAGQSTAWFWQGLTAEEQQMTAAEFVTHCDRLVAEAEAKETPAEKEQKRRDLAEFDDRSQRETLKRTLPTLPDILYRTIPPRDTLVTHNGAPFLLAPSINMIFAYRGLGKSIVALMLAKILSQGGEWLGFKSNGGNSVLLVDGELPAAQIQERLREFVGEDKGGELRIWSPEFAAFPNFGEWVYTGKQLHPLDRALKHLAPRVIIFDTLTRCFRFDTNDQAACLQVNDSLVALRQKGICTIVVHHAGKNQTQRGRTDLDDNLDVSVKLDKPYAWQPGDGLAFKWSYEKVRHGGRLLDFEAEYQGGLWRLTNDDREAEVIEMHRGGRSTRAIATALDMSQSAVSRVVRRVSESGLSQLNQRHADSVNQRG